MDENQNFGYNDGSYNNQGADPRQQYGQNEQPFMSAPQNEQPYANGQQYTQNGQGTFGQVPQYNQVPYGAQQQYNQQNFGQPVKAVVYDAVPDKFHGTSVAALVCGILGLILFWFPGVTLDCVWQV